MAINIIPTAGSTPSQKFVTAASNNTGYVSTTDFGAGVYTITTSPSNYQANVSFWNNNTKIVSAVTVNGTVTVNLSAPANKVFFYTTDGSNVVVGFNLTGSNLTPNAPSGTVDTISTTSTYTNTGLVYVVALGAGASGGGGATYNGSYAATTGGGSAGGLVEGWIHLTNNTSVTIGTGGTGVGAGSYGNAGNIGGATIFGTHITAGGGRAGGNSCCSMSFTDPTSNSVAGTVIDPINICYNYGIQKSYFGGLGSTSGGEVSGASGIGLGGQTKGANGTGYASGGAGGNTSVNSGTGANGIVYVIRNMA